MANSALGQQLGLRIRDLRVQRGWSQKTLAEKLHINKSVISYYELGERYPSYDVLISIAEVFHVSIDYLLRGNCERYIDISDLSDEEYQAVSSIIDVIKNKN